MQTRLILTALALLAVPSVHAQLYNPGGGQSGAVVDTVARDAAAAAQAKADAAATPASVSAAVSSATAGLVKSVNAAGPDGTGNVALTIPTTGSIASQITTATSGLATTSALNALSASAIKTINATGPDGSGNVTVPVTAFVTGFTQSSPGTWASLLSTAPCNAARAGSYAVVSDLYAGSAATNEVARCGTSGSSYYWRPQRENYTATITSTGGALAWSCGLNAPILSIGGSFTSTMNINLSTTGCWPGAQLIVANNATLGLFALNVTGLLGGLTKALGLNARQAFYFDDTNKAWVAF